MCLILITDLCFPETWRLLSETALFEECLSNLNLIGGDTMRYIMRISVLLLSAFTASGSWIEFNAGASDGSEPVIRHGETT